MILGSIPYCKNCKWFQTSTLVPEPVPMNQPIRCVAPNRATSVNDMVLGKTYKDTVGDPYHLRSITALCGPYGNWFQAKS